MSKIICITDDVKRELVKHISTQEFKMCVVHNGVNLSVFEIPFTLKRENLIAKYDSSIRFITMVGRFSEAKDQKTVVRAVNLLPGNIHLLLVGRGPLREEVEQLVAELGIENRIHFLGVRLDVPDILRLSDIGVLSSIWDGFGIAAVESMAAGLPTIGSNVDGLSTVIGDTDLLFPQGDYKQLAQLIEQLLSDREFYNSAAKACKARASLFSIEKMVEGYINVYNEVV